MTFDSLFSLDGKVAIVTGASSGLGRVLARACSAAGASVAITARRADRLEELASELPRCVAVPADLTDPDDMRRVVASARTELGPPEILLNVAGTLSEVRRAHKEDPDAAARTIELNLIVPFRLCQLVYPDMRALGRGSIVNVSSISGVVGIDRIPQASYAAAKRGLSGLTVDLAVQWAASGVRVNTIAAGFFRSEMTAELYNDPGGREWLQANTPLPVEGRPEDFVGAVLWLVSDAGRYVTGQTIAIDGGWTAK